MGWLSALGLIGLICAPLLDRGPEGTVPGSVAQRARSLLSDPLLYTGAALLVLLGLHWWNAWWPEFGPDDWFDGEPRVAWLPAAVTAPEARLVFLNFLNAITVALCIRHGISTRAGLRMLYGVVLCSAFALGVFGIVQYVSGTNSIYWVWPRERHFFASFYYENHAAQYFLMMFCLAAGWSAYVLCARAERITRSRLIRIAALVAVLFLSTVFSMSRTGIVLVCISGGVAVYYVLRHLPRYVTSYARLSAATGLIAIGIFGLVLVSGTIGQDIREDFTARRPGQTLIGYSYQVRAWQWEAAMKMWEQRPVFGVGSYGFRYFVPLYTAPEYLRLLSGQSAGNVHNDAVHYLCELGAAGALLLTGNLVVLIAPLVRSKRMKREIVAIPLMGVGMVALHSLYDLPFRSPAVLAAWILILVGSTRYGDLGSDLRPDAPAPS